MMCRAFGVTETGRVPDVNEDNLLVVAPKHPGIGVFAVADGEGGAKDGDVASRLFVDEFSRLLDEHRARFEGYEPRVDEKLRKPLVELLARLMNQAGHAIFELSTHRKAATSLSASATVLVLANGGAFLGHVGNGRGYLIRDETTYRLTEDHTWAAELAKQCTMRPREVPPAPYGHFVTRTFGLAPQVDVDTLFVPVRTDDRFVLCTRGLHRYLRGRELGSLSSETPQSEAFAQALVAKANERGGEDNISVVVIDVAAPVALQPETDIELQQQINVLRKLFLFESLSDQEIIRVMRIAYRQFKPAGTTVIEEGMEGNELYIILRGTVSVTVMGEHLTDITVGGHFGELALLDDQPRSATVTAQEDVVLLTMAQRDFTDLLDTEQGIASKLLRCFVQNLAGRVRELSEEVAGKNRFVAT